jgi:hypothetical protein
MIMHSEDVTKELMRLGAHREIEIVHGVEGPVVFTPWSERHVAFDWHVTLTRLRKMPDPPIDENGLLLANWESYLDRVWECFALKHGIPVLIH